jgi:hypothetical protein
VCRVPPQLEPFQRASSSSPLMSIAMTKSSLVSRFTRKRGWLDMVLPLKGFASFWNVPFSPTARQMCTAPRSTLIQPA